MKHTVQRGAEVNHETDDREEKFYFYFALLSTKTFLLLQRFIRHSVIRKRLFLFPILRF